MRDCVGIIAGVPLEVKYWGVQNPVTPAALTPMLKPYLSVCLSKCTEHTVVSTQHMIGHCGDYYDGYIQHLVSTGEHYCWQRSKSCALHTTIRLSVARVQNG